MAPHPLQGGHFDEFSSLAINSYAFYAVTHMKRLPTQAGTVCSETPSSANHAPGKDLSISVFGSFRYQLVEVLRRKKWSTYKYAQRLGHRNSGLIDQVIAGNRKVPLESIHDWLDTLAEAEDETPGLSEEERGSLYLAALQDYAPSYVLDIINSAEKVIEQVAGVVIKDRTARGMTTPPLPTLRSILGRRPPPRPERDRHPTPPPSPRRG